MRVKEQSEKAVSKFNIQKTKIMASNHFMANRWGNVETGADFIFLAPKSLWMVTAAIILKDACSLEGKL